ncbi:MAG: YCF48-related protein [Candidatus Kryptoniota bacterium]
MKQTFAYSSFVLASLFLFGGTTYSQSGWIWQNPPQQAQNTNFLSVSFADADTGFVVGDSGTILHTGDGGTDWISQLSGTTQWLRGVSAIDANTATAVGDSGIILHTTDGGAVWECQSSGTAHALNAVSFADADTGTVVGDSGTILRTANGGAEWTSQSSGTVNNLRGVSFTNSNTGTAVGDSGTILRTTNGGATWTNQSFAGTDQKLYQLYGVSFTDVNTGTVGGYSNIITDLYPSFGPGGIILRTTDGGITWYLQRSYLQSDIWSSSPIFGVSFTDANTGIVVGHDDSVATAGVIWRITDVNEGWINQSVENNAFYGVCFTDSVTGTVVGDDGAIFHTTTGGVTAVRDNPAQMLPNQFVLEQNYPNPFNPSTAISYQFSAVSHVTLKVYDILGRQVATLVNEDEGAGYHTATFDASRLASGVYFYRLTAPGITQVKKMVVTK